MGMNHFISIKDLTKNEIFEILEMAKQVKDKRASFGCPLIGKSLALIFQKPSLRTRVSFEVGFYELGGHSIYLAPDDVKLGQRESVKDFAKVLSRYAHGIVFRSFSHEDVVTFAMHSSIPVINGLSDLLHPCQGLADLFTIWERAQDLSKVRLVYIGDGNNVLHSLLYAAGKTGMQMIYCTPQACQPDSEIVNEAMDIAKDSGAEIFYEPDPKKAVKNADFIYTDVWVSMGQEDERDQKLKEFEGYQINQDLINAVGKQCYVMHCLPAHRGEEISDDVIDSDYSVVYHQAENRMHAQKAVMLKLMQ